jgi:hypothetical protein
VNHDRTRNWLNLIERTFLKTPSIVLVPSCWAWTDSLFPTRPSSIWAFRNIHALSWPARLPRTGHAFQRATGACNWTSGTSSHGSFRRTRFVHPLSTGNTMGYGPTAAVGFSGPNPAASVGFARAFGT